MKLLGKIQMDKRCNINNNKKYLKGLEGNREGYFHNNDMGKTFLTMLLKPKGKKTNIDK